MTTDEENRRSEDGAWPVINHRLTALEQRVDRGFSDIDHKLDNLAFVRADVYAANEAARDQAYKNLRTEMRTEVAQTKRLGVWALGLFGTLVAGGLVTLLISIAQGGV